MGDLRDGELILAVDRPKTSKQIPNSAQQQQTEAVSQQKQQDTLLVGQVVVIENKNYQIQQQQHQQQQQQQSNETMSSPSSSSSSSFGKDSTASTTMNTAVVDTRLSVPSGSVQVGKFMYPKKHPSFFDQPMFKPQSKGTFQLRQVLGTLNQKPQKDEIVEKFSNKDFYNKVFLLTSHPLKERK